MAKLQRERGKRAREKTGEERMEIAFFARPDTLYTRYITIKLKTMWKKWKCLRKKICFSVVGKQQLQYFNPLNKYVRVNKICLQIKWNKTKCFHSMVLFAKTNTQAHEFTMQKKNPFSIEIYFLLNRFPWKVEKAKDRELARVWERNATTVKLNFSF